MMIEEETLKDRRRECIERVTRSKAARKRGDVESNRKREKQAEKESNPIARQEKVGAGNRGKGASISMKSIAKGETDRKGKETEKEEGRRERVVLAL